ncbi:hypothetical protein EVAR_31362_1 [Eumeta japonica]|uniref:Uncharacterized protein n=1 Tax=Eumeta variegata TaxID=151549 RepID=A0A4C1X8H7_EUMVA|nr:hypothetical protein EVAR_31362_1 [Eumeta japonica]
MGRVLQFIDLYSWRESDYAAKRKRIRKREDDPVWKSNNMDNAGVTKTADSEEYKKTAIRPLPTEKLMRGHPVERNGRLHSLSVKMKQGMVKLNTRISRTEGVEEETKSQAVLAGEHPYTRLYIAWMQVQMHHGGVEMVVNELQDLRNPSQADIPVRPWCTTRGRSHTLIWTLRPVPGHRGPPTQQTIRRPFHMFDHASRSSRARGVPLRGCSHTHSQVLNDMSGVSDGDLGTTGAPSSWVRTTSYEERYYEHFKRERPSIWLAGDTYRQEQHPKEEVLSTLLAEVEFTVNSRLLTHVSVSAEDPEALTPNHFLMGGAARVPTPGAFVEADLSSRQQWRCA